MHSAHIPIPQYTNNCILYVLSNICHTYICIYMVSVDPITANCTHCALSSLSLLRCSFRLCLTSEPNPSMNMNIKYEGNKIWNTRRNPKFLNVIITAAMIAQGRGVSELPRYCEVSGEELEPDGDYLQTPTVKEHTRGIM